MQRNRIADRARGAVEAAIVELAAERSRIDEELQTLVAMLAASEPKQKRAKSRTVKKTWARKKREAAKNKSSSQVALDLLLKHDEVSPTMLAKKTGQTYAAAGQMLTKLAEAGTAKRLRRGVYARSSK